MNIASFAASRGKSKQRVYQMIKEAGLKVSDLTDGQGQITESGLEKLNEIVPDKVTVPEGESETEQSSGSAEKQTKEKTKESGSEQQSLLDTIKNLSASLDKAHEHIDKLTARLEQEQINLSQEQHLHAITKQELHDLRLRLGAGSPEGESEKPIPAESPETVESETVKTDLEGESLEEKKQDPEKAEGETAPAAESSESSSPVTTDQKQEQKPEQKPEEKTKATLKQRLRFLFTGER